MMKPVTVLSLVLCACLAFGSWRAGQVLGERHSDKVGAVLDRVLPPPAAVWSDLAADAESYARQLRALESAWQKEDAAP